MFWIELAVVLLALLVGARLGGMGLGIIGGLGLAILVFGFGLQPGAPPIDVLLMIAAVVVAAGSMETAGGLDWLVQLAERILRSRPRAINFLGPMVIWLFTVGAGTGHMAYAILPIIAEIARETGIRPERPMSISSIAAQLGIVASPISAAVVALISIGAAAGQTIELTSVLRVTVPASFGGMMLAALVASRLGKELADDPAYQQRMADQKLREEISGGGSASVLDKKVPATARTAVVIFLLGVFTVVFFGMFRNLRPSWGSGEAMVQMKMSLIIEIVMLSTAAIIVLVTRTNAKKIVAGAVMRSGMTAFVAIFGIAWMGNTFFGEHKPLIAEQMSAMVKAQPWTFALALFTLSVMVNSQAATTKILMPLGFSLGVPVPVMIGIFPSVYGYFFIPNYPIDIASISFDRTGTTRIGKYLFNHSFMIPGLVAVSAACVFGTLLSRFFG